MTTTDTRAAAYYDLRESLGARQQAVLSLVRLHPGHTALELAKLDREVDPNRVRPRLVELRVMGHIEEAGIRRCSVSGQTVMTWRLKTYEPQGRLF